MSSKYEHSGLTIVEAVEALSGIVDLDLDYEGDPIFPLEMEIEGQPITAKNVEWLQTQDTGKNVQRIREIFHVVLNYIRRCYDQKSHEPIEKKTLEGIKAIMTLVGEAAKKLDRYKIKAGEKETHITQLKEYRKLQDFYHKNIEKTFDERILSRWLFGLMTPTFLHSEPFVEQVPLQERKLYKLDQASHVFIDLDVVKKDGEYELLLLRKEDGSRFYNPRLLRNLKLVCNFSPVLTEEESESVSLSHVQQQEWKLYQEAAKQILDKVWSSLMIFYAASSEYPEEMLVENLKKTIMALMLCARVTDPRSLEGKKQAMDYFSDFQHFLREILYSTEYQKLLAYPPKDSQSFPVVLLNLVQALCQAIYLDVRSIYSLSGDLDHLMHEIKKMEDTPSVKSNTLSEQLENTHEIFVKFIQNYPKGPLEKILQLVEEGEITAFDPWIQRNIPNLWYSVHFHNNKTILHNRIPAPTRQSAIHKAVVIEEFKNFLRSYSKKGADKKHLLINLQDRTSWREYARCEALEQLQKTSAFRENVCVVTFATDTEFYHQLPPYHHLNKVSSFFQQFKQHLKEEGSGYYFPEYLQEKIGDAFIDSCFHAIQDVFFEGDTLLKEERLAFILLAELMLHLKILDLLQPESFSFTCKDAIDNGQTFSALLYAFIKCITQEQLSEADREALTLMLYGPALIFRERALQEEPFNRFLNVVHQLEKAKQRWGVEGLRDKVRQAFDPLFSFSLTEIQLSLPTLHEPLWDAEEAA